MKPLRFLLSLIFTLVLLSSSASLVMAASLIVNKTADTDDGICDTDCSLREAIAAASNEDTITFDSALAGQAIHLSTSLLVDKSLSIDGSNLAPHIQVSGDTNNDGTGDVSVFVTGSPFTIELNGIDIVKGITSEGNRGGGVSNFGSLTITNSTLSDNSYLGGNVGAGGIYNNGTLTIINTVVTGNSGFEGGGILNDANGTVTITGSTFSYNTADSNLGYGGTAGGIGNIGTMFVLDSIFLGNSATGGGGAIINGLSGAATISNSSFTDNSTPLQGGAINNYEGTMSIDKSTFTNNSAGVGGGAVYNNDQLDAANSTFSGNSSSGAGGGIYNDDTLTVTNSTFSGNVAAEVGGVVSFGTLNLYNTIIANNAAGDDCFAFEGSVVSGNNNLVEGMVQACGLVDGVNGNIVGSDPNLGSLAGSPAYFPLISGSLAIDMGDNVKCAASPVNNTSQNSITRPQGEHCDIGAYEYEQELPPPTDVPTSTPTFTPTPTSTSTFTPTPTITASPTFTMTVTPTPTILTATLSSSGINDGWVLESGEASNTGGTLNAGATTFILGDDKANKQYLSILHFDTSTVPDMAVITSVTLKIQKQGLTGTDPFTTHGGLLVDIQKPYFGTTAGLVTSDFQATSGQAAVSTFALPPVGNWYSAFMDSAAYAYLNLTGTTQFRLRFTLDDNNDRGADYIKFYSGNAAVAKRPVLVIQYYIP